MFKFYESARTKGTGRTSANIYLQLKWDLINLETHRYNVKHVKSSVDTKAPRIFPHLYYRPKRLQMELERNAMIQRDNKALMKRIATIYKEGGWIDNKNFHEIKSLNTFKRQQEMISLNYENQAILGRLLDCHSEYSKNRLEDEYLEFKKHKAIIQTYPKNWREGVLQMKLMQKHIRAIINAKKNQKYKPEMEKRIEKMALKREANELMRRKRQAEAEAKEEERRRAEQKEAAKERRKKQLQLQPQKADHRQWQEAHERIEKKKEEQKQMMAEEKKRLEEARQKRNAAAKKKVQKWKVLREEEERSQLQKKGSEERRRKEGEGKKAKISGERKKKRVEEWKRKKEEEEKERKRKRAERKRQKEEDLQRRIMERDRRRRGAVEEEVYSEDSFDQYVTEEDWEAWYGDVAYLWVEEQDVQEEGGPLEDEGKEAEEKDAEEQPSEPEGEEPKKEEM